MIKRLADLRLMAKYRPAGYVEDVLAGCVVDEEAGTYDISESHWAEMRTKYTPPRNPQQTLARESRATRRTRTQDAADLHKIMEQNHDDPLWGDKVEQWAKGIGADKAAKAWEEWTGVPCGCGWRKKMLNSINETWRGIRAKFTG